jgi:hypothetical protein
MTASRVSPNMRSLGLRNPSLKPRRLYEMPLKICTSNSPADLLRRPQVIKGETALVPPKPLPHREKIGTIFDF